MFLFVVFTQRTVRVCDVRSYFIKLHSSAGCLSRFDEGTDSYAKAIDRRLICSTGELPALLSTERERRGFTVWKSIGLFSETHQQSFREASYMEDTLDK